MTTTAKRVKKSLKEDQLVTRTFQVTDWAQAHFNQVIIAVVALVAVVAVLVFAANSRDNSARQAEQQMGTALTLLQQGDVAAAKTSFQQIYERHGGPQAAAARFFKAECEMRDANYQQAIDEYDAYLARRADYPLFEAAALIGKAYAYEGLENYTEAAASLVAAIEKLDAKDPRRMDAAFSAAEFFAMARNSTEAVKYYDIVIKDGSGDLKDRATVAAAMLR